MRVHNNVLCRNRSIILEKWNPKIWRFRHQTSICKVVRITVEYWKQDQKINFFPIKDDSKLLDWLKNIYNFNFSHFLYAFYSIFWSSNKKRTRHVEPTSHQNTRSCEVFQLINPSSDLKILTDINKLYIYFSFLCPWINSNFTVSKMQATGPGCWRLREPNPADFVV